MRRLRAAVASAGKGAVSGVVGDDIIVLPDMQARHVDAAMSSRGVVAETGGPLMHLAIVGRQIGRVIMILPNAASVLRPDMSVVLNPKRCEIIIAE